MMKHTPGPWHRDGFNLSTIIRCVVPRGHPDAKHTCGDYETIASCEGENWDANSRLIAAAPEMLGMLKTALAAHDYEGREGWVAEARALVTKVEGR